MRIIARMARAVMRNSSYDKLLPPLVHVLRQDGAILLAAASLAPNVSKRARAAWLDKVLGKLAVKAQAAARSGTPICVPRKLLIGRDWSVTGSEIIGQLRRGAHPLVLKRIGTTAYFMVNAAASRRLAARHKPIKVGFARPEAHREAA